jgi:programmed cell death protein 4
VARCLRELEVPHFHHALVYHASVMAIESMHARVAEHLAKLVRALVNNATVSLWM